jgi:Pectate lyase superfamily protein
MNETDHITRREALKWSATGAALVGAAYIEGSGKGLADTTPSQPPAIPPAPSPGGQSLKGWFDVTAFGAKGDGVTPDEDAINRALTAALDNHGGVVWFPPGIYLIESKVIVKGAVTLLGAGWDGGAHPFAGSWILTKTPGVNLEIHGRGASVQAIGFSQSQPPVPHGADADWKPLDHDFAVLVTIDDVFLKQLHFLPCTKGIKIQSAGRAILDHIFGQPLVTGIEIDGARDVVKVNNVHFWPFWNSDSPVRRWMRANATGLNSLRADNPQFSNLFFLGYNSAIAFGASKLGHTAKFKIVNTDCDECFTALKVTGRYTDGFVTNFSAHGSGDAEVCVSVVGEGITVSLDQLKLTTCLGSTIHAQGKDVRVFASNLWAGDWNCGKTGAPGIQATDGATIYLGRPATFRGNHGAPNWQSNGARGGRVLTGYDELICT